MTCEKIGSLNKNATLFVLSPENLWSNAPKFICLLFWNNKYFNMPRNFPSKVRSLNWVVADMISVFCYPKCYRESLFGQEQKVGCGESAKIIKWNDNECSMKIVNFTITKLSRTSKQNTKHQTKYPTLTNKIINTWPNPNQIPTTKWNTNQIQHSKQKQNQPNTKHSPNTKH